jgi:hypothetical protein
MTRLVECSAQMLVHLSVGDPRHSLVDEIELVAG